MRARPGRPVACWDSGGISASGRGAFSRGRPVYDSTIGLISCRFRKSSSISQNNTQSQTVTGERAPALSTEPRAFDVCSWPPSHVDVLNLIHPSHLPSPWTPSRRRRRWPRPRSSRTPRAPSCLAARWPTLHTAVVSAPGGWQVDG